jgi:hypothetical protein
LDDDAAALGSIEVFGRSHHPCLGFSGGWAHSAAGGKLTMSAHAIAESLKQRIPLLDYLRSQDWQPPDALLAGG